MRGPERRALLSVGWIVALLLAVPSVAHAHGPLAPYRWVSPPPEVSAGNVNPLERTAELPARRDRLPATEVWTGDLQAVLSLADTPLPGRERSSVSVVLAPHDATTLGRVPAPLSADGNAYAISIRDDDADVGPLTVPGTLTLAVPHAATAVLFSPDGASWTVLAASSPAPNQVETTFNRSGYYLAATDHPLAGGASSRAVSGSLLAALVTLPVLAVGAVLVVGRRSARRRAVVSP